MEPTTEPETKKKHLIWIIIGAAAIVAVILLITLGLPSSGPRLSDNVSVLEGQVASLQTQMTTTQGNLVNLGIRQAEIASNFTNVFALVSAIPNWSPTISAIQSAIANLQSILANYWAIHTSVLNSTNLEATVYGAGNFTAIVTAWGNWTAPSVSLAPGSANCTISDHYLSANFVTIFVSPLDSWENGAIINIMIEDLTGSIDYASSSIGGSL